jgi:hypothetical protein
MRKLFFSIVLFSSLNVFAQTTRTIKDFSALTVSGSITAELIKSTTPKVEITMLKGQETDVVTDVSSGELKVKMKNGYYGRSSSRASVKIYYTALQEISANAGSKISSKEKIEGDNIDVSASSGSSVSLQITTSKIGANASSGSRLNLYGKCINGDFDASSGATISASDLSVENLEVDASSGASLDVWATESIDADSSSGGNIKFKGEPKKKKLSRNMSGGRIDKE